VCPVSNGWVTASRKVPELATMLDKTLLATVNSDDPAYFEAYVNENFAAVAADGGLTTDHLTRLARNSFDIAWLPAAERADYLDLIDAYVTAG
jgi:adenine deaminase